MPARKKPEPDAAAEEAKARYAKGQPVTLKQLAWALEISYEQVRAWRKLPDFPYMPRLIFPEDFKLWRQRRFGLTGRVAKTKAEPAPDSERQRASRAILAEGIPARLPEKARRIYENLHAGLRRSLEPPR